ncbi:hypothetical protein BCR43DRAFT_495947 [Syncephalastrum racemosum]|uniref:Uncharacterized protein n=1 Tax=Syncephalastrum racemosum TaxID=13706 RepID=A0A1X2H6S7_SYNRA|nr:hypothetical protein BCR43DRAFT_495947 [Syncephalastrum racemosum]
MIKMKNKDKNRRKKKKKIWYAKRVMSSLWRNQWHGTIPSCRSSRLCLHYRLPVLEMNSLA